MTVPIRERDNSFQIHGISLLDRYFSGETAEWLGAKTKGKGPRAEMNSCKESKRCGGRGREKGAGEGGRDKKLDRSTA